MSRAENGNSSLTFLQGKNHGKPTIFFDVFLSYHRMTMGGIRSWFEVRAPKNVELFLVGFLRVLHIISEIIGCPNELFSIFFA